MYNVVYNQTLNDCCYELVIIVQTGHIYSKSQVFDVKYF